MYCLLKAESCQDVNIDIIKNLECHRMIKVYGQLTEDRPENESKICPNMSKTKQWLQNCCHLHVRIQMAPLKNHQNIGFLRNTGPDTLKNHKDTKPAFNVGPSSVHQRNPI